MGLVKFHLVLGLSQTGVVEALAEGTERSTGEQDDTLQLLVEEEVVKAPDGAILSEGVQCEVGVVGVDVALQQVDLGVEGVPQLVVDLAVLTCGRDAQQIVNVVGHKLQMDRMLRSTVSSLMLDLLTCRFGSLVNSSDLAEEKS